MEEAPISHVGDGENVVPSFVPPSDGDNVTAIASDSGERATDLTNEEHDPQFEPIINLPEVVVSTNEENEDELLKIRARLYRFDAHQWKERGTGDIKLLRHRVTNAVRVVMRRDKTLKICANHYVTPTIEMNIHCNSDRAFNWSTIDFADESLKSELFAIKFGTPENASIWKAKFDEAQEIVRTQCSIYESRENVQSDVSSSSLNDSYECIQNNTSKDDETAEEVTIKLDKLNIEKEEKV